MSVTTQHDDNLRSGANLREAVLMPANVGVATFGMIFARAVDDQMYAQPLVVPGVEMPGQGTHDVVYVATMSDSVYAFDARDPAASKPLWQVSFVDPANGVVPVDHTDVGWACGTYEDISGNIGILSTPVIDEGTGTLYLVAKTKENVTDQVYRLHALDITTGAERPNSPVVLSASAPGTGDGSVGGTITFDASVENQRSALTLANGLVYIAFSSYCDTGDYHGWILAYDAQTLAQTAAFDDTPDGSQGGIWMSGQGASVGPDGNVWLVTGNGTFDASTGGTGYGVSVVKLSPALSVVDWFTPHDADTLNTDDLDLTAGTLLIPSLGVGVTGGKAGVAYVVGMKELGHWQMASDSQIVQSFQVDGAAIHGSPVVWDLPSAQRMYLWGAYGALVAYAWQGSAFQPVSQGAGGSWSPGGVLSLSANGVTHGTGIVWATHPLSGDANQMVLPGVLQAFDADDLGNLLWDSQMNAARDGLGNYAKFAPPTVANGRVYVATFSNQLAVYGLLGP